MRWGNRSLYSVCTDTVLNVCNCERTMGSLQLCLLPLRLGSGTVCRKKSERTKHEGTGRDHYRCRTGRA
jgi:hypothetical protein